MNNFTNDKNVSLKNQSFNLIVNSMNNVSNLSPITSLDYYFDWSQIPDIPYNVHMCYMGELNDLSTGADLAMIYINLGCKQLVYECNQYNTSSSSNFIGFLRPERYVTSSYLYAEDITNPPIYISGRPNNNVFTVQILNNLGAAYVPTTGALAPYVINLKFVPANQNE
jgi:hypothetical protein